MKKDYIVELREEEADELMDDHWVGELVRCKNCKHYRYYGLDSYTVSECKIDHAENPDGEWFCADGERERLLR